MFSISAIHPLSDNIRFTSVMSSRFSGTRLICRERIGLVRCRCECRANRIWSSFYGFIDASFDFNSLYLLYIYINDVDINTISSWPSIKCAYTTPININYINYVMLLYSY
jgi:hypothetical protein